MPKKKRLPVKCPGCDGAGSVCCKTWAEVRASAGPDLEFNELGIPLWPLTMGLEMPKCPWCGARFRVERPKERPRPS